MRSLAQILVDGGEVMSIATATLIWPSTSRILRQLANSPKEEASLPEGLKPGWLQCRPGFSLSVDTVKRVTEPERPRAACVQF